MQTDPFSKPESDIFDIKNLLFKAFSFKYLYIASTLICFIIAFLTNKYSSRIFEVSSTIGPVEDNRSSLQGSNDLFRGLGAITESRNLENDINSLKSFTLVFSTLNSQNLEVGYFTEINNILNQTKEIYTESPFRVVIDKSHVQPIYCRFYIKILNDYSFRLNVFQKAVSLYNYVDNQIVSGAEILSTDTICRFNETISNKYFKFAVSYNKELKSLKNNDQSQFYFEFYHLDHLTQKYLQNLNIEKINPKSSIIRIRFSGVNEQLINNFLNKYIETYLEDNLSKKNKIAVNTIKFIDSQLSEISDSLVKSETKLKDYRSANQVMDLSYQGQQAFDQMTGIESDRSNLLVQERYYNYILDYFNKNKDMAGLAPPSSANVVDPIMNQLIMDLLTLNAERSSILSNNNEKNLFLGQIENKIKLQKQAIIENVSNNLNTLNLSLNELNYRSDKISKEISKLPRTELNMVSMQRKFNLSDAIYTFLLQKRSEAAITMASNHPDYEILEPARFITTRIIAPKTITNYLTSIFLGLLIPTIFIFLKDFLNQKISNLKDIEHLINRSVVNIIYTNTFKGEVVVSEYPKSHVAESFRNLRSNLLQKIKSEKSRVILVTSAQPQDGKSFTSINLASSIASVGYKTIILDCDLRRPTLHIKFKQENTIGLSNYMINDASREEIIRKTFVDNLWFISAGPAYPNPSEMIASGGLDELIEYLNNEYEYIIIDTTPAGIVSDASLLMKYASQILLVCRNNSTRKDVFANVLANLNLNNQLNYDVVFNDLDLKKSLYGRYNSYYSE